MAVGVPQPKLGAHGAASCRFATRPVLRTRPGHPEIRRATRRYSHPELHSTRRCCHNGVMNRWLNLVCVLALAVVAGAILAADGPKARGKKAVDENVPLERFAWRDEKMQAHE